MGHGHSEFDTDTAVRPAGDGRYEGAVTPRWDIADKPNGGYLMALAGRALQARSAHPDPLVVSAFFLRPSGHGPVTVEVEPLRAGRSVSTLAAGMVQGGTRVLHLLATFGDLGAASGPTHVAAAPPDLPPPERCVPGRPVLPSGVPMPFVSRFDARLDPATVGWASGAPSGRAEMAAWLRFADGRPFDPLSLLVIVDALPPPVLNLGILSWVPTLELTAHVRARPAPGWLRCRSTTRFLMDGYLEEDCEVWDSADRLVAQARQLARAVAPG